MLSFSTPIVDFLFNWKISYESNPATGPFGKMIINVVTSLSLWATVIAGTLIFYDYRCSSIVNNVVIPFVVLSVLNDILFLGFIPLPLKYALINSLDVKNPKESYEKDVPIFKCGSSSSEEE